MKKLKNIISLDGTIKLVKIGRVYELYERVERRIGVDKIKYYYKFKHATFGYKLAMNSLAPYAHSIELIHARINRRAFIAANTEKAISILKHSNAYLYKGSIFAIGLNWN